jgi:DNA-binding NarL/FixJ family response regulator
MMGKRKKTFLIVDDSGFISERLMNLLKDLRSSPKVYTACTFTEVAGVLEADSADIILLDINLPYANSLVLVSILKELYPHVAIIILTNNFNKYYLKLYRKIGAGYFVDRLTDLAKIPEIAALEND